MYAPGAGDMMKDFHQTNSTIASLSVTLFLLGFAVGPMLIAPLSELYGRLPLYHACNAIFIIFCIAAAVSTDIGMFLAFRFLAGCGGSAPLTLGGGTIADVIPQEKRGGAMALYAMGPLIGPVIGPVAGGFAAQSIGWRWTFWILAIAVSYVHLQPLTTYLSVPGWESCSSMFDLYARDLWKCPPEAQSSSAS